MIPSRRERNDQLDSLLKALDMHAPGERAHAERVAVYAVATGEKLGLSDDELLDLRYAATLHDVGKVRVDEKLLKKLGTMDDDDFRALRMHALMAEQIVAGISWLEPTIPMIRHHHERWDGEGYPDRMAGADIPIGARIIGVAEVYDVLATGTSYGIKGAEAKAVREVKECSGSQFDPTVVAAFLEVQPLIQPVMAD